jgi:hypothetical protein
MLKATPDYVVNVSYVGRPPVVNPVVLLHNSQENARDASTASTPDVRVPAGCGLKVSPGRLHLVLQRNG